MITLSACSSGQLNLNLIMVSSGLFEIAMGVFCSDGVSCEHTKCTQYTHIKYT